MSRRKKPHVRRLRSRDVLSMAAGEYLDVAFEYLTREVPSHAIRQMTLIAWKAINEGAVGLAVGDEWGLKVRRRKLMYRGVAVLGAQFVENFEENPEMHFGKLVGLSSKIVDFLSDHWSQSDYRAALWEAEYAKVVFSGLPDGDIGEYASVRRRFPEGIASDPAALYTLVHPGTSAQLKC